MACHFLQKGERGEQTVQLAALKRGCECVRARQCWGESNCRWKRPRR